MEWTALAVAVLTARAALCWRPFGFARGGLQGPGPDEETMTPATRTRPGARLPLGLVVPHASLALVGIVLWTFFAFNVDRASYSVARWIALVV
jgi:hypothetical protein